MFGLEPIYFLGWSEQYHFDWNKLNIRCVSIQSNARTDCVFALNRIQCMLVNEYRAMYVFGAQEWNGLHALLWNRFVRICGAKVRRFLLFWVNYIRNWCVVCIAWLSAIYFVCCLSTPQPTATGILCAEWEKERETRTDKLPTVFHKTRQSCDDVFLCLALISYKMDTYNLYQPNEKNAAHRCYFMWWQSNWKYHPEMCAHLSSEIRSFYAN